MQRLLYTEYGTSVFSNILYKKYIKLMLLIISLQLYFFLKRFRILLLPYQ